jgi:lipopolysaccharide transport system permease protein
MNDVRVYSSEPVITRPRVLLKELWRDLFNSRSLAWRLAVRDIRATYRQSFLGILWAFIIPLANALVWILLRGTGIVSVRETDIPYPAFVFSGAMLWAILTESLLLPLQKTLLAKSLITKINFQREALILSGIFQAGFNAGIKAVLILLGVVALGAFSLEWTTLLFPLGIVSLVLTGTAIGLLLTPIGVLYTDIGRGLSIAMQFAMYVTPVVFPIPKEGWISVVISYNPLTPLILTTRDWLTGNPADFIYGFIWVNLGVLAILFVGLVVYKTAMPFLIERMNS